MTQSTRLVRTVAEAAVPSEAEIDLIHASSMVEARTITDYAMSANLGPADVVLLDPRLPGLAQIDAVRWAVELPGRPAVIVIVPSAQHQFAIHAVEAGAHDVLFAEEMTDHRFRVALRVAYERQQHWRRLQRNAEVDALTGVACRLTFTRELTRAIGRAAKQDRLLTLLYIDLNRFKEVNDRLGHGAGDAVLRAASRRLVRAVRDTDLVARLGGDEFAAVLYNCDAALSQRAVRTIRQVLSEPYREAPYCEISASIGVATYPFAADSVQGLLHAADAAMYEEKNRGH